MFFKRRKKPEEPKPYFRIREYDGKFTVQKLKFGGYPPCMYLYYTYVAEYDNLNDAKTRLDSLNKPEIIHS